MIASSVSPYQSVPAHLALLLIMSNHSFQFLHGYGNHAHVFTISTIEQTFDITITLTGQIYLDETEFSDAKTLLTFIEKTINENYDKNEKLRSYR